MEKNLKLLQTFIALICHDLAGSIGTVDNCLDLMDASDESISERAKNLAKEEADNLIRKLYIFSKCYGLLEGETSPLYLRKFLKDLFLSDDIQFNIYFEDEILQINSLLSRIIICLLIITKEQPKTEKINLFFARNNIIKIIASGNNLKLKKDSFWRVDSIIKPEITVTNVRQCYINMMCEIAGYEITAIQKANAIEYNLVKI